MKYLYTLTIAALLLLLTGCVSIDKIEDNFIDEGFSYQEDASDSVSSILDNIDDETIVDAYIYRKGIDFALIIEFDSREALNSELQDNDSIKTYVEGLEEEKLIRGNFLLLPITISETAKDEMIEIFNK